jgi:hypothetical protein
MIFVIKMGLAGLLLANFADVALEINCKLRKIYHRGEEAGIERSPALPVTITDNVGV